MALTQRAPHNERLHCVDGTAAMIQPFAGPLRRAVATALLLLCGSAAASDNTATTADALQRDLATILECKASPETLQAVGATLRAAMYGDAGQRPAHLREWRFTRGGDEEHPVTTLDMPQAVSAHGIATRRLFVDGMGFWMPVGATQRDRTVAAHALRLRSSDLEQPYRVWVNAATATDAALPASVVVRSDGEGERLGCDYPGAARDERVPARLREVATAEDLSAALECRADEGATQRIRTLLERVFEGSALGWPDNVIAAREQEHRVGDGELPVLVVEFAEPFVLQGLPVRKVAVAYGGYIAGDLGNAPIEKVLRAAGMTARDQGEEAGMWERVIANTASPAGAEIRSRSVVRTDEGVVLSGCMVSRVHSVGP